MFLLVVEELIECVGLLLVLLVIGVVISLFEW